jgi:hypothetical protein
LIKLKWVVTYLYRSRFRFWCFADAQRHPTFALNRGWHTLN